MNYISGDHVSRKDKKQSKKPVNIGCKVTKIVNSKLSLVMAKSKSNFFVKYA
jgi:hypothetical protein